MSSHPLLYDEIFWKVLQKFNSNTQISFPEIERDFNLSRNQIMSYLSFFKEIGFDVQINKDESKDLIYINNEFKSIEVSFSFIEWLQLQACFPKLTELEGSPFFSNIKEKLIHLENENYATNLYKAIETLQHKMNLSEDSFKLKLVQNNNMKEPGFVSFIEEAILAKRAIGLKLINKNEYTVLPHKLVYLDSQLCLMCESLQDRALLSISLDELVSVYEENTKCIANYTIYEVDDFICSLRAISENEVRLVLKIYSRENFSLSLKHHFFANQCLFTNPQGDHIWAASVEMNDKILDWLSEFGQDVEVLDPVSVKKDLLRYCEEKLKKIA